MPHLAQLEKALLLRKGLRGGIVHDLAVPRELRLDPGELVDERFRGRKRTRLHDLVVCGPHPAPGQLELFLFQGENVAFSGEPRGLELGQARTHEGGEPRRLPRFVESRRRFAQRDGRVDPKRSEHDQDQAKAEGDPGTDGVQARATEHGAEVLCGRGSDLGAKT